MYDFEKYENLIRQRLSDYRYTHSINVAKRARDLARLYGQDEDKAYLAGVLHDITKEATVEEQEKLFEDNGIILTPLEKSNKKVYHQMSGELYSRVALGINDEDVLSGIRYHTTGHSNMTDFEMIIYLADLTSAERSYPDVDKMRSLTDTSLLDAMLYALKFIITDLTSKNQLIHPDTLHCYNWVLQTMSKGK